METLYSDEPIISLKPVSALYSFLATPFSSREIINTMAKRLHPYIHAPLSEMISFLQCAGYKHTHIKQLCNNIVNACPLCARSVHPLPSRKVFLTYVCQQFNEEIQMEFMFVDTRTTKQCALHIGDTGTRYSECVIVSNRSSNVMARELKSIWLHRHGTPKRFSSNSEFTKCRMKQFLATHYTAIAEQPV